MNALFVLTGDMEDTIYEPIPKRRSRLLTPLNRRLLLIVSAGVLFGCGILVGHMATEAVQTSQAAEIAIDRYVGLD